MSALRELQRGLQARVLHGDARAIAEIVGDESADAPTRIGVYEEAYRLRLVEVLRNELPGLRLMAGDDRFDALCRDYVDAHPSSYYNVRWYGERLPSFLATAMPWSAEPALAEMAALEWDMTTVFDAADDPVAAVADIAALPPDQWPKLRIALQGAVRWRALHWNVAAIRRALDLHETVPAPAPIEQPETCVVWRKDRGVRYRLLETDEAALVEALRPGLDFADLCERLLAWHADDAVSLRAVQLLKTWVDDQWLRSIPSPGSS